MSNETSKININLNLQANKTNKDVTNLTKNVSLIGAGSKKSARSVKGLTKSFSGLSKVLFGLTFVKTTQYLSGFVKNSMEAIESTNLFNVAMGSLATSTEKTVDALSKASGLDTTRLMNTVGGYNLLARSMGVATEKAQIFSINANNIAQDLASLTDRSFKDVSDDVRSGLVGQSETMYKYGVDVTEAALKQEALNQGIAKSVRNMTQAEKMQLRYAVMLKQTAISHGDFANTINEPANQLKILQERLLTLSRSIGSIFIPALSKILPILNALAVLAKEFADRIAAALGFVPKQVENTANNFSGVVDEVDSACDSVDDLTKKISKLASFDQLNILGSKDTALDALNGSVDINIGSYETGMENVKQESDEILTNMRVGLYKIQEIWKNLFTKLTPSADFDDIRTNLQSISESSGEIGSKIAYEFKKVGPSIESYFSEVSGGIKERSIFFAEVATAGVDDALKKLKPRIDSWSEETSVSVKNIFDNMASTVSTMNDVIMEASEGNRDRAVAVVSESTQNFANIGMTLSQSMAESLEASTESIDTWTTNNKTKIQEFIDGLQDSGLLASERANKIVADMIVIYDEYWDKWGEKNTSALTDSLMATLGTIMDIITTILKPVVDYLGEVFLDAWSGEGGLSTLFAELGDLFGNVTQTITFLWQNVMVPLFDFIVKTFGPGIANAFKFIIDVVMDVVNSAILFLSGFVGFFKGIFQTINGILTGDMSLILDGLWNTFRGFGDMVFGLFEWIFNIIGDVLNVIINSINMLPGDWAIPNIPKADWSMPETIPDWIKPRTIPQLAQGGILSAGQPFIAGEAGKELIGSYNNKTTVMPLENTSFVQAIKDAVKQGVQEASGTDQSIVVNVAGKTLVEEVVSGINRKTRQTGKSVFEV